MSNENGVSFIKQFKYIRFKHKRGFDGSIVMGETLCGAATSPIFPICEMEHVLSL